MSKAKRGGRTMVKTNPLRAVAASALTTNKAAAEFRKAAADYTRKATVSKAAARQALIGLGIYTASGKLTKNYK